MRDRQRVAAGLGIGRRRDCRHDAGIKGGHGIGQCCAEIGPDLDLVAGRRGRDEGEGGSGDRDRRVRHGLRGDKDRALGRYRRGGRRVSEQRLQPEADVAVIHGYDDVAFVRHYVIGWC
jgi:hypothetical protein